MHLPVSLCLPYGEGTAPSLWPKQISTLLTCSSSNSPVPVREPQDCLSALKWNENEKARTADRAPALEGPQCTAHCIGFLIAMTLPFQPLTKSPSWNDSDSRGNLLDTQEQRSHLPDAKRSLMSTRNFSSATWASVMRNTVLIFFTPAFRHKLARSTCRNNRYQRSARRGSDWKRCPTHSLEMGPFSYLL